MDLIISNKFGRPVFQLRMKLDFISKIKFCLSLLAKKHTNTSSQGVELNFDMDTKEAQKFVTRLYKRIKNKKVLKKA